MRSSDLRGKTVGEFANLAFVMGRFLEDFVEIVLDFLHFCENDREMRGYFRGVFR